MEVDPSSLDPELRIAKMLALASAAFGIISLCSAIVPTCGGITSILGVAAGLYSLRTEHSKTAIAGVVISSLGLLVTVVYGAFLLFFKKIN